MYLLTSGFSYYYTPYRKKVKWFCVKICIFLEFEGGRRQGLCPWNPPTFEKVGSKLFSHWCVQTSRHFVFFSQSEKKNPAQAVIADKKARFLFCECGLALTENDADKWPQYRFRGFVRWCNIPTHLALEKSF